MHFSKSEYIGDIISGVGGAFKLQSFTVNPGLFNLFPYGATIANSFAQYQFVYLKFRYVPTSGHSTGNTDPALGTVAARFLYDPTEALDDTYFMMQSQHGSHTSMTAVPFVYSCGVDSTASRVQKVRTGSVPTGQDPRMYDLGIFEIATNGCPEDNSNLGQLFVDYEIRLMKPVLVGGFRGGTALFGHWGSTNLSGNGNNLLGQLGPMTSVSDRNTLTPYIPAYTDTVGPTGNVLYLPVSPIKYRLWISLSWTAGTAGDWTAPAVGVSHAGIVLLIAFDNGASQQDPTPESAVTGLLRAGVQYIVEVGPSSVVPSLTFTGALVPYLGTNTAEVIMSVIPFDAY